MKKKIFMKATSLFLAFMFMLVPVYLVGVSADDIVNVSIFDVVDEYYIIEEAALEESILPVEEVAPEELIMVIMAATSSTSVPQSVYAAYDAIKNGYDWLYEYHEYANDSKPYLPGIPGVSYVTYYMHQVGELTRLVIGSNQTAYYSPNHYQTWFKMY